MIEKKKSKEIEELAIGIALEIREVIDVLNMLIDHGFDIDDKNIALISSPCVLVRALETTLEKSDKVCNYLQENKINASQK